jgi:hypothetical protein
MAVRQQAGQVLAALEIMAARAHLLAALEVAALEA